MSVRIIKANNNEYIIDDKNNQVRVISFLSDKANDDNMFDIIYRETELGEIEKQICELEKRLSDSLNNSRLFKRIKSQINLLIKKYELLEHDLVLIKTELGFMESIKKNNIK